jgi:hypothetical protein
MCAHLCWLPLPQGGGRPRRLFALHHKDRGLHVAAAGPGRVTCLLGARRGHQGSQPLDQAPRSCHRNTCTRRRTPQVSSGERKGRDIFKKRDAGRRNGPPLRGRMDAAPTKDGVKVQNSKRLQTAQNLTGQDPGMASDGCNAIFDSLRSLPVGLP